MRARWMVSATEGVGVGAVWARRVWKPVEAEARAAVLAAD